MVVRGIRCPNCKDFIFSRAKKDFRQCTCNRTFVNGGVGNLKFGYEGRRPDIVNVYVDASLQDLYEDWKNNKDKLGIINSKDWNTELIFHDK